MIINNKMIPKYGTYSQRGDYHEACYICPSCFRNIKVQTAIEKIEMKITGDFVHDTEDLAITISGPKLTIRCDKCGDYMFDCDERLVGAIIKLNNKGYITQFCCEGHHIYRDSYHHLAECETCSAPYVKFLVPLFKKGALISTKAIAADVYTSMYKPYENQFDINHIDIISFEEYETVGNIDTGLYKEVRISITNEILCHFFDPDENDSINDAKNYDIFKKLQHVFIQFMNSFSSKLPNISGPHIKE